MKETSKAGQIANKMERDPEIGYEVTYNNKWLITQYKQYLKMLCTLMVGVLLLLSMY